MQNKNIIDLLLESIINNCDMYKHSMFEQYPEKSEFVFDYVEGRLSNSYNLLFGPQAFVLEYLLRPITMEHVEAGKQFTERHNIPFNYDGWRYIVEVHNGYLPLKIRSVAEGSIVPTRNVLCTVVNTDPNCYWVTTHIETAFLRAIWYPTTVATTSYEIRCEILKYLQETGTPELINTKLVDFGARGVSSFESAGLGGMAHLVAFDVSDTNTGILFADKYYNHGILTLKNASICAMEHTSVISWGRTREADAYKNMLRKYGTYKFIACVSDAYDIFNACENIWGDELHAEVIDYTSNGSCLVIRPDCYDDQTLVLTQNGWKLFNDLTDDDLVYQVDDNNVSSLVKPIRIIKQHYVGDMIKLSNISGKIDLVVTPKHRIMLSKNSKFVERYADELPNKMDFYNKFYRSSPVKNNNISLTNEERFKIMFQADGNQRKNLVRFTFSKERKIEKFKFIADNLNIDYKPRFRDYNNPKWKNAYEFEMYNIKQDLLQKDFSWVDDEQLNCSNFCREFIEELSLWDSTIRYEGRIKYDNTNKTAIDVVERIALNAGYGVFVSEYDDKRSEKFSKCYSIHIMKDNLVSASSYKKETIQYDGFVHCVEVPTGRIIVKRNKSVLVCGNSGIPKDVCLKVIEILEKKFGSFMNDKGYKVLNHNIRIIQGDGVRLSSICEILEVYKQAGYSADNITFGMGGALLQDHTRDDYKFAMKCSAIRIDNEWEDVKKAPVTDLGKESKSGRLTLVRMKDGSVGTILTQNLGNPDVEEELLQDIYYQNGLHEPIIGYTTFNEVRANAGVL